MSHAAPASPALLDATPTPVADALPSLPAESAVEQHAAGGDFQVESRQALPAAGAMPVATDSSVPPPIEAAPHALTAVEAKIDPPAWLNNARDQQPSPTKKSAIFYDNQGSLINSYLRSHNPQTSEEAVAATASASKDLWRVGFVVRLCFIANVLLLGCNIIVVVWSGSLAVIGASIDCALDLLSTGIIFYTARKQAKSEPYLYPVGKTRLEPLSIVIFASIMAMAAMLLAIESIQSIVSSVNSGAEELHIDTASIVLLAVAIFSKFLLMATCYCMRTLSDSIFALALEYRNDAIITLSSLVAVLIASRVPVVWWLDPALAIVMAGLILVTWLQTGKEHVAQLAGKVRSGLRSCLSVSV